jgi:pilus assembly protein Flp/PilA
MVDCLKAWLALNTDRRGVTMLEYALIGALIAAVCVGAVTTFGTNLSNTFTSVASSL